MNVFRGNLEVLMGNCCLGKMPGLQGNERLLAYW
jgi:hypothetical protein